MVMYRRNRVEGGSYFFTVTLRDRRAETLVTHVDLLRSAVREVRHRRPFRIDAMVVLPDHLHAVWTMPPEDADYSGRWRSIKSLFVRGLHASGVLVKTNRRGEADVWQTRFWEHTIRDERDYAKHVEYIHFNPVKHQYVQAVAEWPYSSFHRFVRAGLLPGNWAGEACPVA